MAHSFRSAGRYCAAILLAAGFAAPALHADAAATSPALAAPSGLTRSATTLLDAPAPEAAAAVETAAHPTDVPASGAEMSCLAKVVHHEAANQSLEGQLAVAQVILNRTRASGFASTVCGVVAQRGQFFDVGGYRPPNDGRWRTALSVARQALNGDEAQIVPGALFYCASASRVPAFMRSRQQLAKLGDHVFYR